MLEAAIEEDVEIRLVELDVLSQTSVDSAVASSTLRPPPGYGDRLAGSQ
jgi:hypothetical protein